MEVEIRELEEMTSLEFFAEGFAAFGEELWVGGAGVDEVAVVAHDVGDAGFFPRLFPPLDFLVVDWLTFPRLLVVGKELNCGGTNRFSFEESFMDTTCG